MNADRIERAIADHVHHARVMSQFAAVFKRENLGCWRRYHDRRVAAMGAARGLRQLQRVEQQLLFGNADLRGLEL
jgi:hypothetical protein